MAQFPHILISSATYDNQEATTTAPENEKRYAFHNKKSFVDIPGMLA